MSIESCGVANDRAVPHFSGEEGFALDMDRTLADSQKAVDSLIVVAGQFGVDGTVIRTAQKSIEADGGSFAPISFLEEKLNDNEFDKWGEAYLADETNILYDDTTLLLEILGDGAIPHLIPTFGVNTLGQYVKGGKLVRQTGRSIYMEVMEDTDKGTQEEGWRGRGGTYDFEALDKNGKPIEAHHMRSMALVDDKDKSHVNTPHDARGYNLKRPGAKLKSQSTGLPESVQDRVTEISTLDVVTADIKAARYVTKLAACSPVSPTEKQPVAGYRPAYPNGDRYPGLLITPETSFRELREAAAKYQAALVK